MRRALARSCAIRTPARAALLGRALRPFILRRTKEQVAPELPAKIEQTLFCELPPAAAQALRRAARPLPRALLGTASTSEGLGTDQDPGARSAAAPAPGGLPSRACSTASAPDEPCAKLDLLLPQLREVLRRGAQGAGLLAVHELPRPRRAASSTREGLAYVYLDGQTRDRQEQVERFQTDPACRLFLISLKAGGLGLNLTAADYVFLLDPWWNPAVEAQAIDRAHRIGQTRPVFAYRLVARDTVEEKILELQKSKRELADAIIQADDSLLAALSREDLELLLS